MIAAFSTLLQEVNAAIEHSPGTNVRKIAVAKREELPRLSPFTRCISAYAPSSRTLCTFLLRAVGLGNFLGIVIQTPRQPLTVAIPAQVKEAAARVGLRFTLL